MKKKVFKLLAAILTTALVADLTVGANSAQAATIVRPTLTAAAYDMSTGVLSMSITNVADKAGDKNDIDLSKMTIYGNGSKATLSTKAEKAATGAAITLSDKEQIALGRIFTDEGSYTMTLASGWNGTASKGFYKSKSIKLKVTKVPELTSVTYDYQSGALVLNGSDLKGTTGSANDIDPKFIFVTNGSNRSYRLTSPKVELDSSSKATIALNDKDKEGVQAVFDTNTTKSQDDSDYQLFAEYGWNGKITPHLIDTVEITVSNYNVPTVTLSSAISVVFKKKATIPANSCNRVGTLYAVDSSLDLTGQTADDFDDLVTSGSAMKVTVSKKDKDVSLSTSGLKMTADQQTYQLVLVDKAERVSSGSSLLVTVSNLAAPKLSGVTLKKATTTYGTKLTTPKLATAGNKQYYEISDTKVATTATPKLMTDYTSAVASGTSIKVVTGASLEAVAVNDIETSATGKYMTVYELNSDNKLVKYVQVALTTSNVRPVATVASATATASGTSITVILTTGKFSSTGATTASNWTFAGDDVGSLTISSIALSGLNKTAKITVSGSLAAGKNYTIIPKNAAMDASSGAPLSAQTVTVN